MSAPNDDGLLSALATAAALMKWIEANPDTEGIDEAKARLGRLVCEVSRRLARGEDG